MKPTRPIYYKKAMEPITTPSTVDLTETPRVKRSTPWGLFIGLVLILAIIVLGAYHAFTERIAPVQNAQSVQ